MLKHWKSKVSPHIPLKLFEPHAREIWTKLYCLRYTKFWAFWREKTGFLKPILIKVLAQIWESFLSEANKWY